MASGVIPGLLKAFIRVAQGKESFKYEGYALAAGLFLVKCVESLSERQWNFQTRLIGAQVRSMLSAAIDQKQLRLSNAAHAFHSPGQIMNYFISSDMGNKSSSIMPHAFCHLLLCMQSDGCSSTSNDIISSWKFSDGQIATQVP